MQLKDILNIIKEIQSIYNTSETMICGGLVRDKYMNRLDHIDDLDLTTGDQTIKIVSSKLGDILSKKYKIIERVSQDGHTSIKLGNIKIDFSSNYIMPNILVVLNKLGIVNPNLLTQEMFSRDFTCNALLLNLDLNNIKSPIKTALDDINNKIIKTCLPPNYTLVSSKNRVVRSIYLASKLSFSIDPTIINFVKNNPNTINISIPQVVEKKLDQAFDYDADRAVWNISQMNLWDYIPITEKVKPYYVKLKGIDNGKR